MPEQPLSDFDRALEGATYHNGLQDTDRELFERGGRILKFAAAVDLAIDAAIEEGLDKHDVSRMLIKLSLEVEEDNT